MRGALGLLAYRLTAGRRARLLPAPPPPLPRPPGRVVLCAARCSETAQGLAGLARRLLRERPDLAVVLGCASPDAAAALPAGLPGTPLPPETTAAVAAFLDHWQPALLVVAGGDLRPLLVEGAARRGLPLLMVEGEAPTVAGGSGRWWPGLARRLLRRFAVILAADEVALRALRRAGAPAARLRAGGRLETGSRVLPCNEAERAALARGLGTRPVWLAAAVPEAEDAIVAAAHQAALRLAHRLLLILVPDDPGRAEVLAARLAADHGLTVARRAADQEIDDETQVYVADTEGEMGLWYRLAPIAYLGGSLAGSGCLRHPFEPAALGAAIVHGPARGAHRDALARLAQAGGARALRGAAELELAVGDLLSPDRAARLAQAAWDVASVGAETTDQAVAATVALLEPAAGDGP
jgi:3-deoxy-D-manno-octulosonic-acid transferase